MIGPLIPHGFISIGWDLVIALLLGIAFGFVLESSGFSSSRKLVGVFYGYDFTVFRVFFTAVVTTITGLLYFNYMGWIEINMIYVNPTFLYSGILGSLIMGLGFITGGYCPGTSFCGAAIGKVDAMIFTLGMFLGIFIFSETFPLFRDFYYISDMGPIKVNELLNLSGGAFLLLLVIFALIAFILTSIIEKRVKKVEY
ncbi:MAG: YeeE/YedE family protein [Desulfobacteraceae bacterium]|nr:YeeE/YedE family protein [Desulfobacteraceae bacterium]